MLKDAADAVEYGFGVRRTRVRHKDNHISVIIGRKITCPKLASQKVGNVHCCGLSGVFTKTFRNKIDTADGTHNGRVRVLSVKIDFRNLFLQVNTAGQTCQKVCHGSALH